MYNMSPKDKAIRIMDEVQEELVLHKNACPQDIGTIITDVIGHGDFEGELVDEYPELYEILDLAGWLEIPESPSFVEELHDELMTKINNFQERLKRNDEFGT